MGIGYDSVFKTLEGANEWQEKEKGKRGNEEEEEEEEEEMKKRKREIRKETLMDVGYGVILYWEWNFDLRF